MTNSSKKAKKNSILITYKIKSYNIYITAVLIIILLTSCTSKEKLPLKKSISQYGITWTFSKNVQVGKFITGDYYVVGPVTIISVTPAPENGRNGSMLNGITSYESGYDSRTIRYDEKLTIKPPITMKPGHSLISTISLKDDELHRQPVFPRPVSKRQTYLKSAAVLTCMSSPVSSDAFRPSYSDTVNSIYYAKNLRRNLLPKLPRVKNTPNFSKWERIFERPWIDHTQGWGNRQTHSTDNMPEYAIEISKAVSAASLLLMLDFPDEKKEKLLLSFIQYGIDLWGIAKAGGGWEAAGGYGVGRKWPIILAGILLGDKIMQMPNKYIPGIRFSEDEQTIYGSGWTGAKALFAGHSGIHGKKDRGPYEHLHPSKWQSAAGEQYRRGCSVSWIGTALAARIMHAENLWSHNAFFDYADRWMTEDDAELLTEIRKYFPKDLIGRDIGRLPQGTSGDRFIDEMWKKYQNNIPDLNN